MNVLAMSNVSKTFKTGKTEVSALSNLTLNIDEGRILGLLGPNGSGKTTTVKIACGLLMPDSGQVLVLNKDIREHRSYILSNIGVLLEPGKGIYKNITVLENIMYWGLVKGVPDRRILEQRANELTEFFGIESKRTSLAATLSTGMVQKLNLCCTLVTGPKLILLDEPNVGMDVDSSIDLAQKLRSLAQEQGCSVLVTSHQMDFMEDLCDEVAFISDGKMILRGSIDEVRWLFRRKYYKLVFKHEDPLSIDLSGIAGVKSFRHDLPDDMAELIVDSTAANAETLMKFALDASLEVVALELVQPTLKECYQMLFAEGDTSHEFS